MPQVPAAVVLWTLDRAGLESLQLSALRLQLEQLTTHDTAGHGILISQDIDFGHQRIRKATAGGRLF